MTKPQFTADDCAKLPATAAGARALGVQYYYTGKPCSRGHTSPRYASSCNCVDCLYTYKGEGKLREDRSAANMAAAVQALEDGVTTYVPDEPCKHGHRLRYVGSNNCVECNNAAEERRRASGYHKWRRLEQEYGLSKQAYEQMLSDQNGLCAVCRADLHDTTPHVDHCHASNKVRGLLCGPCNQAIGLLREDPKLFNAAVRYLERHK